MTKDSVLYKKIQMVRTRIKEIEIAQVHIDNICRYLKYSLNNDECFGYGTHSHFEQQRKLRRETIKCQFTLKSLTDMYELTYGYPIK